MQCLFETKIIRNDLARLDERRAAVKPFADLQVSEKSQQTVCGPGFGVQVSCLNGVAGCGKQQLLAKIARTAWFFVEGHSSHHAAAL